MSQQSEQLDRDDSLQPFRSEFCLPASDNHDDIYFVGNSLGLMPRRAEAYVQQEMEKWKTLGVGGHFSEQLPWADYHAALTEPMARLVGANPSEVVVMNSLTVNLHLMLATFYRPKKKFKKILIEDRAFPSDQYAIDSHVRLRGLKPAQAVIRVQPDNGQLYSTEHICETIKDHSDSLALILLPGVQYYTGQVFDMAAISELANRYEIPIGFDLAHAVGNVPLKLHDWRVDFAVWCNYKYLNSGPGAVGGCFIHEGHVTNERLNRLAGWWGHDRESRFQMDDTFQPIPTADGWQLSNPPIMALAPIRAALEVFEEAGGIEALRAKSVAMQQFFRDCLNEDLRGRVNVVAPIEQSGCQLSLEILSSDLHGKQIHQRLEANGIRTDWREPNVIRAAPVPLYNSFTEIERFVEVLSRTLRS